MSRRRQPLFRLIALALSLALAGVALELFLRIRPVHERFRDSAVRTDRLSPPGEPEHRVPFPTGPKPPGVFRILVVGDSYTFGDGVHPEDAFPQRLEARLAANAPERPIEVVSWARRGWNTDQEMRSVRPHIDEIDPDLLIIGFTLNDTEPTAPSEREALRERILPRSPTTTLGRWAWRHSELFGSIWRSLENIRLRRELGAYYRSIQGADGPGVAECRSALKSFKRMARQREIPLLVAIFPIFDSQLDHRYRYHEAHTAIAERLENLGIRAVDLLPYYQGLDARRLAVVPFTDPHPNELAHRIAADAILAQLVRARLLPIRKLVSKE